MSSIANRTTIPVPLPPIAHKYAQQNAVRQTNNERARSVYLRTLAAYAVHSYLQCVNIDSDLEDTDLWNGLYDHLSDSANLDLLGIGQLECCPVLPDADSFVPPQLPGRDSIIYIAVQFKEVLDEAELIGFRPILNLNAPPAEIFIDYFQELDRSDDGYSLFSIEHLLEYLYQVEDLRQNLEAAKVPVVATIRQWLEEQADSLSQFSVEVIAKLKACEPDLMMSRVEELFVPLFSNQDSTNSSPIQLMNSSLDSEKDNKSENSKEETLRKTTEEFVEWFRNTNLSIINNDE